MILSFTGDLFSLELGCLPHGDKKWDLLYKSLAPETFTIKTAMFTLGDSNFSALPKFAFIFKP
ncbi:hypothetical protein RLOC_00004269 [Lonchura striata]|uniref:Uncharacterized protein n=1 Tax=Lonchura striata TaxID=40157 RepID=A0A218UWX5_9PASE|nr:hypothetical protein RLOC_00004269 [Lonchura striata domestica]